MNPCYNCESRHPGCHGTCGPYKDWKKEVDEKRETIRKQKIRESEINERTILARIKRKK